MAFLNIIPKAHAQGGDAIAQPTFGPIVVSPGDGSTTAVVNVTLDNTSPAEGDIVTASVFVSSADVSLAEMTIIINYDSSFLTVIDQDPNTLGTQVEIVNQIFTVENTEQDNNININGDVRVRIVAPDGNPLVVAGDVIEIKFQAQRLGNTSISVREGVSGTRLSTLRNDIAYTGNSVTLEITSEGNPTPNPDPQPDPDPDPTPDPGTDPGTNPGTGDPGVIPDTSINSTIDVFGTLLLGVLLISLGLILRARSKLKKSR